jgi:hypothetical protein
MRNGVCPACQGSDILLLNGIRDGNYWLLAPVRCTVGKHSVKPIDPIGLFIPLICRRCGFTQLLTSDPGEIPIGEEYNTQLWRPAAADAEPGGPPARSAP